MNLKRRHELEYIVRDSKTICNKSKLLIKGNFRFVLDAKCRYE
jgi:hypothetical protein